MAHPPMFDDDDPMLERVRRIALCYPDAAEKISHGRPAFFTTKVFAYYGGSERRDGHWTQHEQSIMVKSDADERQALLADSGCYLPAYLGQSGWVGVDLSAQTDWTEVAELIESSYRMTAGVKRVARLDRER